MTGSPDNRWVQLQQLESTSVVRLKMLLIFAVVGSGIPLLFHLRELVTGELRGIQLILFIILGTLGCLLLGLLRHWLRYRKSLRLLTPAKVALRQPAEIGKLMSAAGARICIRIEQSAKTSANIERFSISLEYVKRKYGQDIEFDGPGAPYVLEGRIWSMTQNLDEFSSTLDGSVTEYANFVMPGPEIIDSKTEVCGDSSAEQDSEKCWQIRLKTCLVNGFVAEATFKLSSAARRINA